jgi:hypothetical protein
MANKKQTQHQREINALVRSLLPADVLRKVPQARGLARYLRARLLSLRSSQDKATIGGRNFMDHSSREWTMICQLVKVLVDSGFIPRDLATSQQQEYEWKATVSKDTSFDDDARHRYFDSQQGTAEESE